MLVGKGQARQNTAAAMEMGLDEGLALGEREDRIVIPSQLRERNPEYCLRIYSKTNLKKSTEEFYPFLL